MKKELIILIGNIGAGKSTLAKGYVEQGYVIIARDALRYGIGGGKYIFNLDYEPLVFATELYMFKKFVDIGVKIAIDEIGISKEMRKRYIHYAKRAGYNITAVVLKKLSKKESVDRRMQNPHGQFDRKIWDIIWEKFDKLYEFPTKKEGFNTIIKL